MAVLLCLVWGAVVAATIFVSFSWYLPFLSAKPSREEESETRASKPQITRRFQAVIYIVMILVAMICGYVSGNREDAFVSIFKMLLTLDVLSVVTITDIKLYKIPNLCILVLLAGRCLSIIPELVINDGTLVMGLLNSVIAGALSLLFLLLMSKITHGGIGYGDIKLFGALGFLCGVHAVVYTLLISFFLCAVASAMLLLTKKKHLKDGLPMGPFIWIGFAITIIVGLC